MQNHNSKTLVTNDAPNSTSLAPCKSPSGPARAVSVCPQRGVLGMPLTGNSLGLGAGRGLSDSSPSILAAGGWPQ